MKPQVQSKHLLNEELLISIWHRSALDECFNDWRREPQTDLGVFSSDLIFFWMNWLYTNKGLVPVFDLSLIGEPTEWRIVNLEDKSPHATLSRLNGLAARLKQLKQRRS